MVLPINLEKLAGDEEDDESEDEEIQELGEEGAVGDMHGAHGERRRAPRFGTEEGRDRRHENIFDERIDHISRRRTHDESDGERHDLVFFEKRQKFFEHESSLTQNHFGEAYGIRSRIILLPSQKNFRYPASSVFSAEKT